MINKAKGTYDVYGDYGKKFLYLEMLWQVLMKKYNYQYIRTPIFEASEVFLRGVGATTDIVNKETYTFLDRGNRSITLRPEGTAAVVRSYIENKMENSPISPLKLWYYGSMFRYERPQSGRFREFYQFGVEVLKGESPMIDAEVISIAVNFLKLLGLKGIKVNLNTLGDLESRKNYNQALFDYFKKNEDKLSLESKKRLKLNPLRILDSKEEEDQIIINDCPKMSKFLNAKSKDFYQQVKQYLDLMGIDYQEKENLVRGLDYYTHTVFEIEADIKGFGAQNILCGGGRYDGLVKILDGPDTKGVGFALGIERIILALEHEQIDIVDESLEVYVISLSEKENKFALKLTSELRSDGFNVEMDMLNRNLKNNFKYSEKLNAKLVIIIGEEETKSNILTVKSNLTKEEYKIEYEYITNFLEEKLGEIDVKI